MSTLTLILIHILQINDNTKRNLEQASLRPVADCTQALPVCSARVSLVLRPQEIQGYKMEAQKQSKLIYQLEKEREKYSIEASDAAAK